MHMCLKLDLPLECNAADVDAYFVQGLELQGEFRKAIKSNTESILASVVDYEVSHLAEDSKRCRRKMIAMLLTF